MNGVIAIILGGGVFLLLLIIFLNSRTRFKKIDEMYGKPYKAKLVQIIGGHPELKRGTTAMSFHPKNAIAFNRKVFLFSQISSIRIITNLPKEYKKGIKTVENFEMDEQYLCLSVTDEYGEHEVIFTAKSDFKEFANQLMQIWNKYNLLSQK